MPDLASLQELAVFIAAVAVVGWKVVELIRGGLPGGQGGGLLVSQKTFDEYKEQASDCTAELKGKVDFLVQVVAKMEAAIARIEGKMEGLSEGMRQERFRAERDREV